jgi:peptide/nickel transport system substrate-binding protein
MTQALKIGEIDALFQSEATQLASFQSDPNIDAIHAKLPGFSQIGINIYEEGTGNPLLQDVNIRYAMEYAVDREKIRDMVFLGCAEVGSTILSKVGGWGYDIPASDYRSYNLDKANAILDAAGYTARNSEGTRLDADGNALEFDMIFSADVVARGKIAAFLKEGCDKIGIKINNRTIDKDAIADAIAEYSYDLFIWGWFEDVDPSPMLNILTEDELFYNNETGFVDERYDELYYMQLEEMDEDARIEMVNEMQKIAYDACPYIIVAYDEEIQAVRSDKWTGYIGVPQEGPFFINNTFLNYLTIRPVQ